MAPQLSGPTRELQPYLHGCGYSPEQVALGVLLDSGRRIPLAAFASSIHDSRTACVAVVEQVDDVRQVEDAVLECRELGAPIVFVRHEGRWLFWKQSQRAPELIRSISPDELETFFRESREALSPGAIYRAKTWARFDPAYQLDFVDVGLMPIVEEETGRRLSDLIERVFGESRVALGWDALTTVRGQWLLKANFWLLAAKMLKDKHVGRFTDLDLEDVKAVFSRVEEHYGAKFRFDLGDDSHLLALRNSAREFSRFSSMEFVSTEALSYLYENALITDDTRSMLGTHSTPVYLVDYILGRLRPWIEEIPYAERDVFEPACGHAGFLLSAMRLLDELRSEGGYDGRERHQYLRSRLHGWDIDSFALEIARLRLTLADVPNPNGWDLKTRDVFRPELLESQTQKSTIILANPPFEAFSSVERKSYKSEQLSKAVELFRRIITNMRPNAVVGFVLPRNFLQGKGARSVRETLATAFELQELCLLPDKVFARSDSETVVVMARRLAERGSAFDVRYVHVRENGYHAFKQNYSVTSETYEPIARFREHREFDFSVSELDRLWKECEHLDPFSDVVEVKQGLSFRPERDPGYPPGAISESVVERSGFYSAFSRLRYDLHIHELPDSVWFDISPDLISRPRGGTVTGVSQVLMNYAPASRGPWRIKAFLDYEGHAISSRFLALRPRDPQWSIEAVWALCNSPFANAYAYVHGTKRDIPAGVMRKMRVPLLSEMDNREIKRMVRNFIGKASAGAPADELRVLHWRIDAKVLDLYQLPSEIESELLRLFSGSERRGVPYKMRGYFPQHATTIRLTDLITVSEEWERANQRRGELIMRKAHRVISDPERTELERLQGLADLRIRLFAPLPSRNSGIFD